MVQETPSVDEIKEMLELVTGVTSVKPVITDGLLTEVHVIANPDRNPKQVVRDIESICRAKFNIALDHKKISVAQIQEELSDFHESRLHPKAINISKSGPSLKVDVILFTDEGKDFLGSASGPTSTSNVVRLAAQATLAAVQDYLFNMCQFTLDDAVHFTVGSHEGVLVGITILTPKGEESLVGSVLVQSDVSEAAVKAVLNAVNRRVVLMVAS